MTAPVAMNVLSVMDEMIQCYGSVEECSDDTAFLADARSARAAVAELIEADKEFDSAWRDWNHVTAHDPEETSDETWRRVADRFEAATMRRLAALARCGGAQ